MGKRQLYGRSGYMRHIFNLRWLREVEEDMDGGFLSAMKSVVWPHGSEGMMLWGNPEQIILPRWI